MKYKYVADSYTFIIIDKKSKKGSAQQVKCHENHLRDAALLFCHIV